MNGIRFALVFISFFALFISCASPEKALLKHEVLCKNIIATSFRIYHSGADSLLAQDQYYRLCDELSEIQEIMAKWMLEIEQ